MTLFLTAIISSAIAGPLAEGYRGVKWGKYETFPAPTENCRKGNEPGIAWVCNQTIGGVPLEAAYAYNHNIFYAMVLVSSTYSNCSALMDTFEAGWGRSVPTNEYLTGKLDKRTWRDKEVFATWNYNDYSKECTVYMIHNTLMGETEKVDKARAADGVKDL